MATMTMAEMRDHVDAAKASAATDLDYVAQQLREAAEAIRARRRNRAADCVRRAIDAMDRAVRWFEVDLTSCLCEVCGEACESSPCEECR